MEKGTLQKLRVVLLIKGNIPIETANICNILPRPADSNRLIAVKLKRDLKYRGYVYFEPVRPNVI